MVFTVFALFGPAKYTPTLAFERGFGASLYAGSDESFIACGPLARVVPYGQFGRYSRSRPRQGTGCGGRYQDIARGSRAPDDSHPSVDLFDRQGRADRHGLVEVRQKPFAWSVEFGASERSGEKAG